MTVRERGIRAARRAAREALKQWGVRAPEHIRLEAFAADKGVRLLHGPLRGARARLSHGETPIVRISNETRVPGAERFSLAHELGHHLLGHQLHTFDWLCGSGERSEPNQAWRDYEAEANAFASELLMPRELVAPMCTSIAPSLDLARAIASVFGTSLPASALRVVQLTRERCAAVYSERGEVLWAPGSVRFTAAIPRGKRIVEGAAAFDCAQSSVAGITRSVPAALWLETNVDTHIVEHSGHIPETDGVITLLVVADQAASILGMSGVRHGLHAQKQSHN